MVQSDEIKLPTEFQVALDQLVRQLQKKGGFENVYRDGDRNAMEHPGTIVLHSTAKSFKQGSERARQVTTVAGATSITVHCRFTDANGHTLLERDIKGKVRFFGEPEDHLRLRQAGRRHCSGSVSRAKSQGCWFVDEQDMARITNGSLRKLGIP